ncbi:MAG: dethiobiotin synthetase [Chloroflexi bacterium]|nr:MAG: dethiobiotin synthetase [Chloroflexota bacterium]
MSEPVRTYLVTGTDTDVGKTVVSGWMAFELASHCSVALIKGIQTGVADGAQADQTVYAKLTAGRHMTLETLISLPDPLAPAIAARRAGRDIDIVELAQNCRKLAERHDVTLIEGSGGLLVPIDADGHDFRHLAEMANASIILVARPGLGTLNHTLLTLEAAKAHGLSVEFIVLNGIDFVLTDVQLENVTFLRERFPDLPLITLHHAPDLGINGLHPRLMVGTNDWPGLPLSSSSLFQLLCG